MSNISSLEAELARQRAINRELNNELSVISGGVSRAQNRLESFNSKICTTLESSRSYLDDSHNKMVTALQTQAEIEVLYVRFKAMELANKRIRDCNNRKYYEFANYTKVRKLVQGIMDNLDVSMASDRVIYKSIERQHLQTPDYWLTCVLISIMAWKNDDKNLADRAMELAMRLDKKGSSVFYMLFNLRMDREDAALKWFYQYQTCELKGSDQRTFLLLFALISRCINSSEELGEHAREEINHFIKKVVEQSASASGYSREDMLDKIGYHLNSLLPSEQPDYPVLRKYCKDYGKYVSILMQAKANINILAYVKEILCVQPEQRNAFIKSFIDELIATANDTEKDVYNEIAYNELIIRLEGDIDKAKEIFGKQQIHDEREINLIYEMIEWIYGADKEDVNGQSRMNMFVLTKDLQKEAIERWWKGYRIIDRRHSDVQIDSYATKMDLTAKDAEIGKMNQYYDGMLEKELASIKNLPAYIGFGVAAVSAVASLVVTEAMLIGTALGAGYGAIKLLINKSSRKQAQLRSQENCRRAEQTICALCNEFRKYDEEFLSFDAYTDEIDREMSSI